MSKFVWFTLFVIAFSMAQAAPVDNSPVLSSDMQAKFDDLRTQMDDLQKLIDERNRIIGNVGKNQNPSQPLQRNPRYMSFQPMKKRMASWQPMKRNADYSKEQVIRAIEEQLSEILRAGETLGVNADEVLVHLKQRSAGLV